MTDDVVTVAWVNGRFVRAGEPGISPLDQGFLLGHGLFETMAAVGDRLPFWDRHLERLEGAAAALEIPWQPPPGLRDLAGELLRRAGHEGQVLRLTLTAGDGNGATWCLTTRARGRVREPILLHLSTFHRSDAGADPLAGLKSTSYGFYHLARLQAWHVGADEALLRDREGRLMETATGNLFLVRDGVFHTPGRGNFLPGIARQVLLETLAAQGAAVESGDYTLQDLQRADAIYVTNAVHGPRLAQVGVNAPGAVARTATGAGGETGNELRPLWQSALAAASAGR